MKIIDFERRGNVVRFYLGKDTLSDFGGDGWNKIPYERAEMVEQDYISGVADIAFPFDAFVLEPKCGEEASSYSKEDMKRGIVPCIIVVPATVANGSCNTRFSYWSNSKGVLKFYFADRMEPTHGSSLYIFDEKEQQLRQENEVRYVTTAMEGQAMDDSKTASQIPVWQKHTLTIKEAAAYFGIGQNRLVELTAMRNCDFVLYVGNRRMIKREAFEKYINRTFSI